MRVIFDLSTRVAVLWVFEIKLISTPGSHIVMTDTDLQMPLARFSHKPSSAHTQGAGHEAVVLHCKWPATQRMR
jgi:hypothetical protein